MQKSAIERLGMEVAPIVVGTGSFGNRYAAHAEEVKLQVLKEWLDRLPKPIVIDSAGKYGAGLALEVIGNGLRQLNVSPDDVIISNKLGWKRVPLTTPEPTFEPGAWVGIDHDAIQQISYDGILSCWNQGNEILGEGFDSKMGSVHDPDEYLNAATDDADRARRFDDILDAYRALSELKDKGQVLGIGVGSKDWTTIRDICEQFAFSPPEIASFAMATTNSKRVASNIQLVGEAVPVELWAALKSEGLIDVDYPYV